MISAMSRLTPSYSFVSMTLSVLSTLSLRPAAFSVVFSAIVPAAETNGRWFARLAIMTRRAKAQVLGWDKHDKMPRGMRATLVFGYCLSPVR